MSIFRGRPAGSRQSTFDFWFKRNPLNVFGVEGNAAVVAHDVRQLFAKFMELRYAVSGGIAGEREIVFLRVFQGLVVVDAAGVLQILMGPWEAVALHWSDPFRRTGRARRVIPLCVVGGCSVVVTRLQTGIGDCEQSWVIRFDRFNIGPHPCLGLGAQTGGHRDNGDY